MRSIIYNLLFFLACAISVEAQSGGQDGSTAFGGHNTIVGVVYARSNHSVITHIKVNLSSMRSHEASTTTDYEGKFVFYGIGNGNYTVSIETNNDFETSTQQIDIDEMRGSIPQAFRVNFYLNAKVKSGPKPGVIKAENAGISKKATDIYTKALELAKKGDHKGAIELLKLAVAEDPAFIVGFTEMGVQYMKLNELEKADEALLAALKIKPDAYEALVNRGIALFRLKRYPEAEELLFNAIKVKDQSAIGHFYLGRTLVKLKRFEQAEKEFKTSIAIDVEGMKESHRMLANLYIETENYKSAAAELETYLTLVPSAPDADHLKNVLRELKGMETTVPKV